MSLSYSVANVSVCEMNVYYSFQMSYCYLHLIIKTICLYVEKHIISVAPSVPNCSAIQCVDSQIPFAMALLSCLLPCP